MTTLFEPLHFGDIAASNRIVMASLTRSRAGEDNVPTPLMATYYAQRATAGLIISEAAQISPEGQGHLDTPGIYSDEQIAGWQQVTRAVHAAGGKIVLQLCHAGRISHVSLLPNGQAPVSSTSTRAHTKTFTTDGFVDVSTPRALELEEMPRLLNDYRQAARRAMEAGFDGVEVHSADGCLLEQFLRDSINDRTDSFGGSKENRVRLMLEVMHTVAAQIGAGRTGIRLSPVTPASDAGQDSDAQGLYDHVVEQLAPLKLAFIHVVEAAAGGPRDVAPFDHAALRSRFKQNNAAGAWIVSNGDTRDLAMEAVASGHADMVAFGEAFVGNPDLVRRLRDNAPLNPLDAATLYGGGAEGYTDYPALQAPAA